MFKIAKWLIIIGGQCSANLEPSIENYLNPPEHMFRNTDLHLKWLFSYTLFYGFIVVSGTFYSFALVTDDVILIAEDTVLNEKTEKHFCFKYFFPERRTKKVVKLHFACQIRGPHCLYSKTCFTMRTRNPKTWIHLMFLDFQIRNYVRFSKRKNEFFFFKFCLVR